MHAALKYFQRAFTIELLKSLVVNIFSGLKKFLLIRATISYMNNSYMHVYKSVYFHITVCYQGLITVVINEARFSICL